MALGPNAAMLAWAADRNWHWVSLDTTSDAQCIRWAGPQAITSFAHRAGAVTSVPAPCGLLQPGLLLPAEENAHRRARASAGQARRDPDRLLQ